MSPCFTPHPLRRAPSFCILIRMTTPMRAAKKTVVKSTLQPPFGKKSGKK